MAQTFFQKKRSALQQVPPRPAYCVRHPPCPGVFLFVFKKPQGARWSISELRQRCYGNRLDGSLDANFCCTCMCVNTPLSTGVFCGGFSRYFPLKQVSLLRFLLPRFCRHVNILLNILTALTISPCVLSLLIKTANPKTKCVRVRARASTPVPQEFGRATELN